MDYILLIGNIAILISVSVIFNFISRHWKFDTLQYRILTGILFGLATIIGMIAPAKVAPGVFFDGRSIILSIAGLFAGSLPALLAAVIAATFRYITGGAGVPMGLLVITVSTSIGIFFHVLRERSKLQLTVPVLLGIGYLVHLGMLACTLALPYTQRHEVVNNILIPILTVYPIGFLLVSILFLDSENRIKSVEELSKSEARYKQLVENAQMITVKLNVHGEIIFINKYGLGLLGYSRQEIIGRKAIDTLILKENPGSPYFTELGQRLIGTQEALTTEGSCFSRSGEHLTILWVLTNTVGTSSQPEMLCTGNNITGLVGAQEALRESQIRLKSIMDHTNDLICQIDLNGRHLYVSQSYKKILGYEAHDLIGKPFFSFLHPDDLASTITTFKSALLSRAPKSTSVRFRAADGNYVWIESHGNTIINKSGRITGMVVSSRDITEQVKHQKEIEESELRYRTLLNAIPDLMFVQTNDGVYLDYHCSDESQLLFPPQSFIGKKYTEVLPPTILSLFEDKFKRVKEHLGIEKFEYAAKLQSGELGYFEARVTSFGPDKILSIIRDITDRKRAEKAIQKSEQLLKRQNEELNERNQKIVSINKELMLAKEKAEESDRLKSAFLANMSHEIRTPMNGMLGFADLLRRPNLPEEKRKLYVDIINANGNQLLAIINDIIDISKIEAGQVITELIPVNITKLYLEIRDQFTPLAKARNLNFIARYPEVGEVITKTDATKLRQVLFNLLSNAIKFTPSGRVETGFSTNDENLLFYVMDTGIGIQEEFHNTIFERFRQVEDTISRQQGGTGLGLSISKSLVELLGGSIWLESEPGKGSTFFFTIPHVKIENGLSTHNEQEEIVQPLWHGKKVLIGEDDEANYQYLNSILTEAGIQTVRATSGLDVVEFCKQNPSIDLALINAKMPLMNGYETTKQIKELRGSLPVIVQASFVSTSGKAHAYEAGCDAFISKPISKKDLIGLIDRFFS